MILDESEKHFMYVYKWNEGNDGLLVAKSPVSAYNLSNSPAAWCVRQIFGDV